MSGTIATPTPFVPWPVLSSFYSPLKNPSRGQYRQALRFVDGPTGVTVRLHRKGRFAGQRRFHSVLTVLAIRAKESGDAEGAELLHEAAARVEQAYSTPLAHFLQSSSEEDLPASDFYDELVTATRDAIDSWGRMARLVFASA